MGLFEETAPSLTQPTIDKLVAMRLRGMAQSRLVEALYEQVSRHHAHWPWTNGNGLHADNNRCDELARRAA